MFRMIGMHEILLRLRAVKKSSWGLSILTLITLLFSVYRWTGGSKGSAFDYFTAQNLFDKWSTSKEVELAPVEKLLDRRKELHGKFDAKIAQRLLSMGKAGIAKPYVAAVLKRNAALAPHFEKFARTSLLIVQEEYGAALEASRNLEAILDKQALPMLKTCNLVRIALLEDKIGNKPAASKAWEMAMNSEGFADFAAPLTMNGLTLTDFIESNH